MNLSHTLILVLKKLILHAYPDPYASKMLYLFRKKTFANYFKFILDFKSSSIPTPSDPKFMNKLSQIECEISKSLNNLYLNYLL